MTDTTTEQEYIDAREAHKRSGDIARRNEARRVARLATKHTIEEISFRAPMHIRCSCGWSAQVESSRESELAWKSHKSFRGERTA